MGATHAITQENLKKLDLVILDVSSKDKKISLGLKQLNDDPWKNLDDFIKVQMYKVIFLM